MILDTKRLHAAFAMAGFVLGSAAAGFAISNAIVSLLVILKEAVVFNPEGVSLSLDLTSEISLVLCTGILILGILLVRGSLMIWRLSVMGGAINLACGIVLAAFSYAMVLVASNLLQSVSILLLVERVLMGLMAMASGTFGVIALFEQLKKRFVPSRMEERYGINVLVTLPDGSTTQVELKNDDTLSDFKNKVRQFVGKPVENTVVVFRGKKITDESKTLKELGIEEGDKVGLV